MRRAVRCTQRAQWAAVYGLSLYCGAAAACGAGPHLDPLQLEGNRLTISNQTPADWVNVDVQLNTYYHFQIRSIPAGRRYQVPLDGFVAGYGQRFDFKRAQITDLRLTASQPTGQGVELVKAFEKGGLAGALEGLGGKR
jgi:hypothetical protein